MTMTHLPCFVLALRRLWRWAWSGHPLVQDLAAAVVLVVAGWLALVLLFAL
jgi:hypothetical protein